VLLLNAGQAVSTERLVDEIWGGHPPADARKLVSLYVTRLRRVLGDRGRVLVTRPPGYQLLTGSGDIDADRHDDLVTRGRQALSEGDAERAAALLTEALALWRGSALADVPRTLSVALAVSRLEESRLTAVELHAEAALGCGHDIDLVPELGRLADEHPLRERLWALLMRALVQGGRQAEALQEYERARRVISGELGVDPGAVLQQLHMDILAADHSAAIAIPIVDQSAQAAFLPVRQLPPDVADFTGRKDECARLAELVTPAEGGTAVQVAVLSGPPGAGKTTLAVHVAHSLRGLFPDGQLYVQLAGVSARPRESGKVLGELLRALGVAPAAVPETVGERAALFRSRLADRRVLLLADDASSVDQMRPLLPGTAGSAVIVTSRDRLAGLTGAHHVHLESLGHSEALLMVGRIVGERRVAAEPEAADRLVTACGRLPLALRIAGARLATRPSWPLATVAGLICDERRRLDELAVGDMAVRASLALSYQALDGRSQQAFRLLALAGPNDVAGWVVAALLGQDDASDVVNLLTDKSLLAAVGVDAIGQPRYRLHDLLRDYAAERLADEPEAEKNTALQRLLTGWLEIADRADQGLPRHPYLPAPPHLDEHAVISAELTKQLTADPLAWFTTERVNLLAVTELACATAHHDLAARLASCQSAFQHLQSRFDDTEQICRLIERAAQRVGDEATAAHAAFRWAVAITLRGRHADAVATIERCAAVFEKLGDQLALAFALFWAADSAVSLGHRPEAVAPAERGLELARKLGDRHAEMMLLRNLGSALVLVDGRRHGDGVRSAERALAMARELHEPVYELDILRMLAHVNNLAGRHGIARDLCREGIGLSSRLGYTAGDAYFLGSLGDAYHGLGRYRDAIDAYMSALPIFREHGLRRHEALCLLKMAESCQALGSHDRALPFLEECLPVFGDLRLPLYEQRARRAIAQSSGIVREQA
jgi:DNA-binding SARP family transcriptional activator/tetratricopeptide (TPR) repeat protein